MLSRKQLYAKAIQGQEYFLNLSPPQFRLALFSVKPSKSFVSKIITLEKKNNRGIVPFLKYEKEIKELAIIVIR